MAARIQRPQVQRLLRAQLAVLALTSVAAAGIDGISGASSAALGGLVAFLPNVFFAWCVFRAQGARYSKAIVNNFYRAEAGKFGLTAALFTLVFIAVPPSNPTFFFGAYVVTLFVHWLGPWLVKRPSHT